METKRIYSYEPVIDGECHTLILGTMPSVQSLRDGFYYAHPRNAFWRILSQTFEEPLPRTVEQKKSLLLRHHVALWDTAHSCVRKGSLDADMRDIQLNDIKGLLVRYPAIKRVLLNGGEAARLYRKTGADQALMRIMPSTSPAYTLGYEEKFARWKEALKGEIE